MSQIRKHRHKKLLGLLLMLLLGIVVSNGNGRAAASDTALSVPIPEDLQQISRPIDQLMEGRVYAADFGQKDKEASGKDVVSFKDGKMATALCVRFGFMPAPYSVRVEGSKLHFRSEMVSDKQGKMIFTGYVEGDKLIAKAEWTQARWYWDFDMESWFEGNVADPGGDYPVFVK
jgi:hypothetical protein